MSGEKSAGKKRKTSPNDKIRIWAKELQDDNPTPLWIDKQCMVADLACMLAKHPEFSFKGVKVKNIAIYSPSMEKLTRDCIVSSVVDVSAAAPFIASIDQDLFATQIRNFDLTPSGKHDKNIIKYLICKMESYSHFVGYVKKLEIPLKLYDCSDVVRENYFNVTGNISFEANENAILFKVTLMMAIALKSSNYQIVPYHALELPLKKVGYPYTADMLIRDNKSDKSSSMSCSDDVDSVDEVAPIAAIAKKHNIIMVVEIKKKLAAEFSANDPDEVLELLIYCRYILTLNKQAAVIGAMTDSATWHFFHLCCKDDISMNVTRYVHFTSTAESEILGVLPTLLE